MTYYRVDKRLFAVGDCVSTAQEYYDKFTGVSKDVEDTLESTRPGTKAPRKECLFIFEDEICARTHWSKMQDGKLYKVSIDEASIYHRGDMALMDRMKNDGKAGTDMKVVAHTYWRGELGSNPVIEIMVPNATVTEVISTSDKERQDYLKMRWGIKH